MLLAALLVRLPYLTLVPLITDETREIKVAVAIAREGERPLTMVSGYLGAWNAYLLAAGFRLLGYQEWWPRGWSLLLGAATVALTYLLGREVYGRVGGLAAAALLGANLAHVLVNSHLAWSNATTPFYTTLACWLAARAAARGHGPSLVGAGAALGLAGQSHPTGLALAPAIAVYLLARSGGLRWLRTPWPYLALAGAGAVLLPILLDNLIGGAEGASDLTKRSYAVSLLTDRDTYLRNLGGFATLLLQALASQPGEFASPGAALADGVIALHAALAALALLLAPRGQRLLVPAALLASAVLIPYINHRYLFLPSASIRYFAFLLPLLAVTMGGLAARVWWLPAGAPWRFGLRGAVVLGLLLLALWPASRLVAYVQAAEASGDTNRPLQQAHAALRAAAGPNTLVILDEHLVVGGFPGSGNVQRGLDLALTLDDIAHRTVHTRRLRRTIEQRQDRDLLLVLTPRGEQELQDLAPRLQPLTPVLVARPQRDDPARFRVYRLAPPSDRA